MNIPVQTFQTKISLDELSAVHRPIAEAKGMPNAAYTDQACFEFERDNVLGMHWAAIGFAANLAPASVKPMDFMGLPIITTTSKAGEIKVFHNVCSHRGMRLVQEEKQTNGLIVCPYHTWTYALDGELKATPHIGGVDVHQADGFKCENHGLKEIRSHIWMGILFINLDGKADHFEQEAAPLLTRYRALMGESGEQLAQAAVKEGSSVLNADCNWKLAVENYLEAYHLPFVHPSLNSYSPLSEHYNEIISDASSGQITNTFKLDLGTEPAFPVFPDWDGDKLDTGEYPVMYPNLLLGFQANHLTAIIIHPTTPSTCREEVMIFYVDDVATNPSFETPRKANLASWLGVFDEDLEPCERMQIGRHSPGYQGGAFSPVHDTCSLHFHQWIAKHYESAFYAE